jgi:hypothetical protein
LFCLREFNGLEYVVECYNEKFKGGDKPDSIVEIWIPLYRVCRSCAMPMTSPEDFGTEGDGSRSSNYCLHCCENGSVLKNVTIEKLITDVQKLLEIEAKHPKLLSSSLLDYVNKWLSLPNEQAKKEAIPDLLAELIDGQDCDLTGTRWEKEWLAEGKICKCDACIAARRCIADIKCM